VYTLKGTEGEEARRSTGVVTFKSSLLGKACLSENVQEGGSGTVLHDCSQLQWANLSVRVGRVGRA